MLQVEVQNMVAVKRDNLSRAFDLLKVREGDSFVITYNRFAALLDKIPPTRSETTKKILWYVLDQNGDNKVGKTLVLVHTEAGKHALQFCYVKISGKCLPSKRIPEALPEIHVLEEWGGGDRRRLWNRVKKMKGSSAV